MTRKPYEITVDGRVSSSGWYDDDPAAVPRFGFTVQPGHITPFGQIVPTDTDQPEAEGAPPM